ncbi:MAG TPA: glycosyltransferase family 2 protein [Anaerolineales bacterium]|nr:glycosyltransferase family 2 protein [Anaerolineales bacterium]
MTTPRVSIIIPCYNEEHTIRPLLEALASQSYPLEHMEIIIADGMSTDQTRDRIDAFRRDRPGLRVRVADNEDRAIPAALNRAIEAAAGEVIIRLDAHSLPDPDYVERCAAALEAGLGENVGGVWRIEPGAKTWQARAIAAAAAHPLGAGDAHYRRTTRAQYVDTVPFGAFRRTLFDRIGRFDETLLSNEDYEFNARIIRDGGKIWLDPAIRSTYFARPTFAALARQYRRYGTWKAAMLKRYPETLRWRQLVPPLFVAALLVSGLAGLFWAPARLAFGLAAGLYTAALLAAGLAAAVRKRDPALAIGLPAALSTMHFNWGGAVLWNLLVRK